MTVKNKARHTLFSKIECSSDIEISWIGIKLDFCSGLVGVSYRLPHLNRIAFNISLYNVFGSETKIDLSIIAFLLATATTPK